MRLYLGAQIAIHSETASVRYLPKVASEMAVVSQVPVTGNWYRRLSYLPQVTGKNESSDEGGGEEENNSSLEAASSRLDCGGISVKKKSLTVEVITGFHLFLKTFTIPTNAGIRIVHGNEYDTGVLHRKLCTANV